MCIVLDTVQGLFRAIVDGFQDLFDFAVDIGQKIANMNIDDRQMVANTLFSLSQPILKKVEELISEALKLPKEQRTVVTQMLRTAVSNFNQFIDEAQDKIINQLVDDLQTDLRMATDRLQREIDMALDRLQGKGNVTQLALEEHGVDGCTVKVNETSELFLLPTCHQIYSTVIHNNCLVYIS